MTMPVLLECQDLSVGYETRAGVVAAVNGVDLVVRPGEAVGIVGESGCGKTTLAFSLIGHLGGNGTISGGQVRFRGRDIFGLNAAELRALRGAGVAMVYQDPGASLNPSMRVGEQLMEVPVIEPPRKRRVQKKPRGQKRLKRRIVTPLRRCPVTRMITRSRRVQ